MSKNKGNQKQKSYECHHGKGKVVDNGKETKCTKRSGKVCTGAHSTCKRIWF